MKTRSAARLKMSGVLFALVLTGAACGSSDDEAATTTTAANTATTAAPSGSTDLTPVGSACSQVPTSGEGSVAGMADDTVATAASNNPLLSTLVTAVGAAGLVDTLNSTAPPAPFTVFAPINSAFEKVPAADLQALLANKAELTKVLTYHVVPGRYAVADLEDGQKLTTVEGTTLTINKADDDTLKVNDSANVVCADVPTANATVMLIDSVLMPTAE